MAKKGMKEAKLDYFNIFLSILGRFHIFPRFFFLDEN